MLTELRQLAEGLFHPWHFGTVPSALGVVAALTAAALCVGLLAFLFLGRSAPLWMSGLMLLCLVGSYLTQDYPFAQRSAPGANLKMFEVGKALHETMREQLQATGRVPEKKEDWAHALAALEGKGDKFQSPFHRRGFGSQPWRIEILAKEGEFLADQPPGTFQVYLPPDASRFTITMLGLDAEHQVVRLRDDQGEVFDLKGVFTPDSRQ